MTKDQFCRTISEICQKAEGETVDAIYSVIKDCPEVSLGAGEDPHGYIDSLYWMTPEIDAFWFMCLGYVASDLAPIIRPIRIEIECRSCGTAIPFTANDRDDRYRLRRMRFVCPDCSLQMWQVERQKTIEKEELERTQKRQARIAELRAMPYADYLLSPEWRERRLVILERDNNACRLCNSTTHLNVHHRTYANLGDEPSDDLTTLCYPCHQRFHEQSQLVRPS